MHLRTCSRNIVLIAMLLGIAHSVYPLRRPSALLKRSLLRRRLLTMPGTLRPKRQLYREDIPHHRPLTGNTYYLHAGFPHPSRWHDGPQVIPPNPNPVSHHHFHEKPGLHDDIHQNHNHDHNNNQVHHIHQDHHHGHHHQQQYQGAYGEPGGGGEPVAISVMNSKTPHSNVNIHSAIVHSSGGVSGSVVDNALGGAPADQANFDPLISSILSNIDHASKERPGKLQKPHSEPDHYDDEYGTGGGDYEGSYGYGTPSPVEPPQSYGKKPERKPKTIIHYHPVTVGNVINFNDDNKPVVVTPNPHSSGYGPPDHVPGAPLAPKDVLLSVSEPFINSPFKSTSGPPDFLDFNKDNNIQYGPPQHVPGLPLSSLDLQPMRPSYGPPLKPDSPVGGPPPYGVALPVIAHLHSGPPRPPPKRYRGKGRPHHHQHHLHLHHIHHPPPPPPPLEGPFYDSVKHHHPVHVVHGHHPSKFVSVHSPHFRSQAHHHHHHHQHHRHRSLWTW